MKKAEIKYSFVIIVLILLIVIAFILINSNAFGKTEKFVSGCVSSSPAFEYKCANEVKAGSTTCDFLGGWSVDRAKDCPKLNNKEVQCCYKER